MQINTIGSPTGLFGTGGAIPAAGSLGFAALLGAPANPAAPMAAAGSTPLLAANDALAPATPLSMAQLLTTAATVAPIPAVAGAPVTTAEAQPAAGTPALPVPAASLPADAQAETAALPVTAEAPVEAPVPTEPAEPAVVEAKPPVPTADAKPGKPGSKPVVAEPAPEAAVPAKPQAGADAEIQPEQPAETVKAPVKRGPRQANLAEKLPEADLAATPDAAPVTAELAAVAAVQAPVRPEVAAKAQPSTNRQIGEIPTGGRKGDTARAAVADAAGGEPTAVTDKASNAVSAIAGKQGNGENAAGSDERQAPAFTLRQDATPSHAAPTHAVTDPARAQATPVAAAAEPVVAARPGHLGQQMGVEIARKVEAGEDTLRVRLSPENLGKVEVTLSFDDGGKLHATVRAESAHALDLLRQDMPDLGRSLDQAGIRADAQSFRFESRSEGGNAQSQQQNGQNASGNQLAGNDETETTDTAYRSIRGDGQVDLLA